MADWRTQVLAALDDMGPATVNEIAAAIALAPNTVAGHLHTLQEEKLVHTAGRAPAEPGKKGSPPNLWARTTQLRAVPPEAATETVVPAMDDRLRALAKRLGESARTIERLETELAAADARTRAEANRHAEALARAERAEEDARAAGTRLRDTAAELSRVRAELAEAAGHANGNGAFVVTELDEGDVRRIEFEHRVKMRERYFDTLLAIAGHEGATPDVYDRIELLIDGPPPE